MVRKCPSVVLALDDSTFTLDDMTYPVQPAAPALIRARSLSGFSALVTQLGGDPLPLLEAAGLHPDALDNPESCIALEKVTRLVELTAQALDVPDFGMCLAEQQDISVLGAVALIARYSATVSEALAGMSRHLPYHTPDARLYLSADPQRPDFIRICYAMNLDDDWPRRQTIELSYCIMQRFLQLLTGVNGHDWFLQFRHAPGCSEERYRSHLTGTFEFLQAEDALSIPQRLLDTPIGAHDQRLREAAERFLKSLVRRFPLDVTRQVETLVERQLASGGGSLERVAEQLGLHERTLQRRLAEQGSHFEDIVDRLRQERARSLLLDSALPLAEIAAVLGYSEQSSLNRSCTRWFGMSPNALRKSRGR